MDRDSREQNQLRVGWIGGNVPITRHLEGSGDPLEHRAGLFHRQLPLADRIEVLTDEPQLAGAGGKVHNAHKDIMALVQGLKEVEKVAKAAKV